MTPLLLYPSLIIAALVLLSCGEAHEFRGAAMSPPAPLPDFELMAASGEPFHLSDVDDDITLIYFGYTFCPDVCPMTLMDVREALKDVEGRERVHMVMVSVDPERDTPEVLERYVKAFDPTFIGLTDDWAKTQEVMKPYGAYAEKTDTPNSSANYLVNHTSRIYLVSPGRELLLTYPFGFLSEDLRADIQYLLQQSS